jgi:ferredoxin-NADP reductase
MTHERIKPGEEVLRVTPDGEFIWHENAEYLIANGDFSGNPP